MKLKGKWATFTPDVSSTKSNNDGLAFVGETTGMVAYVNEKHQYFRVEYEAGGHILSERFKFSQIGADKDVVVHG